MAETRAAWGIDIGQSALKALKVRHIESAGQVVAEAFDYIPFPKILSQPDAIPEEIVPEAMQTLLSRNDLKGDAVAISVPGQTALARFIQLPPVEMSKLHEIVKYEARQQIPFALEDVIWDYQPLGAGMEESGFLLDAEVGLFAMKKEQVHQQLRPYNNAKVEVDLIQIAPLALYSYVSVDEMAIRRDDDAAGGDDEYFIVLDMGCDNTTLMVSNGYKIWIRNVPIGGNHFTRALTKEMKLSFAKAEHLKCNATKAPDPRAVFQALRPVFNDYVSEIRRSIGYFSSVNRNAKVVKVIGLGNGFKLAGLQKFLQQNLQYDVERPDSFQALAGDAVLNSPLFADNMLSFAVPYGLTLQALELSRIKTSLLPPEIAAARRIRKKKPWAVATAATLLAGFSLSTVGNAFTFQAVHTPEFEHAEKLADDFGQQISSAKSAYSSQESRFEGEQARLLRMVEGRRDLSWIEVYNAVVDCLPRGDDDGAVSPEEIHTRKQISLTEFSADKVANVGDWYDRLRDSQKEFMSEGDKESAPSGEGYIFTLRGRHWRNIENQPQDQGLRYLVRSFLRRLQQPTIQQEGYPERDVTRLGISHATIIEAQTNAIRLNSEGRPQTEVSRMQVRGPGLQRGGMRGLRPPRGFEDDDPMLERGDRPMRGTRDQDALEAKQTDFIIQFVFQYVPPGERTVDEPEENQQESPDDERPIETDDV